MIFGQSNVFGPFWHTKLSSTERIDLLMRRVREAARNIAPETLTKLVHELPARMQEIYKQKGKKIPADWKAKNSRYRCRAVCSS